MGTVFLSGLLNSCCARLKPVLPLQLGILLRHGHLCAWFGCWSDSNVLLSLLLASTITDFPGPSVFSAAGTTCQAGSHAAN